jgi:hypothetical protein
MTCREGSTEAVKLPSSEEPLNNNTELGACSGGCLFKHWQPHILFIHLRAPQNKKTVYPDDTISFLTPVYFNVSASASLNDSVGVENINQFVEWELAGETSVLGEYMPQCHFLRHINWPGFESDHRGGRPGSNYLILFTCWSPEEFYLLGYI